MAKAYQYTADGYYAGEVEDYGLLPNNATYTAPQERNGYVPHWTGKAWEQVEDHKGAEGYVDGQPHTIRDYGPLPAGWSTTPPPPTPEERAAQIRSRRDSLLSATDYVMMPDYPINDVDKETIRAYRQALRDVPMQPGFPDKVIWPEKPETLR